MIDASAGTEPPRRGRPPVSPDGRVTRVSVRVPDDVYDRLDELAGKQDISVPELIRDVLARNFGAK